MSSFDLICFILHVFYYRCTQLSHPLHFVVHTFRCSNGSSAANRPPGAQAAFSATTRHAASLSTHASSVPDTIPPRFVPTVAFPFFYRALCPKSPLSLPGLSSVAALPFHVIASESLLKSMPFLTPF